jgi:hypothetical protein
MTSKIQPSQVSGLLRNGFANTGLWLNNDKMSLSRIEQPQSVVVQTRRVGHAEAAGNGFPCDDIDEAPACGLDATPS